MSRGQINKFTRSLCLGGVISALAFSEAILAEELDNMSISASDASGYSSENSTKPSGEVNIDVSYAPSVNFNDLKSYEKFCGAPSGIVQVRATKELFTVGIPLRLGFSGGYYSDNCKTFQENSTGSGSDLEESETGSTVLKIVPIQLNVATTFELPFTNFFNVDLWSGIEKAYFEETRTVSISSSESSSSENTSDSSKRLVLRGDRNALVFGVGVNFLMNKLDEQSTLSLYNSLGLGKVFLKLFAESTIQTDSDPKLNRLALGLGFGFQTGKP